MLGWLKKRARGSIQARYISCLLRRDLAQADMFVAEPVQSLLTHNLKVGGSVGSHLATLIIKGLPQQSSVLWPFPQLSDVIRNV